MKTSRSVFHLYKFFSQYLVWKYFSQCKNSFIPSKCLLKAEIPTFDEVHFTGFSFLYDLKTLFSTQGHKKLFLCFILEIYLCLICFEFNFKYGPEALAKV